MLTQLSKKHLLQSTFISLCYGIHRLRFRFLSCRNLLLCLLEVSNELICQVSLEQLLEAVDHTVVFPNPLLKLDNFFDLLEVYNGLFYRYLISTDSRLRCVCDYFGKVLSVGVVDAVSHRLYRQDFFLGKNTFLSSCVRLVGFLFLLSSLLAVYSEYRFGILVVNSSFLSSCNYV